MRKLRDYKVVALSEALSPLTHNSGTEGNETLVQQEPVAWRAGIQWAPCLSGNAIRHRMVRAPGARYLVERWGLDGKLTLRALQFMFHGGALERGGASANTAKLSRFWDLFPLYRLLGGSMASQIIPGSMNVLRGTLVCQENGHRIAQVLPDGFSLPDLPLLPAARHVGRYEYYRGNAEKTERGLADPSDDAGVGGLMPYSGQTVNAGALFLHGFELFDAREVVLGALLHSLRRWQTSNATLGGQSARGHGRLALSLHLDGAESVADSAVAQYVEHVEASREEGSAWLGGDLEA